MNDIDTLMSKDILEWTPQDTDAVIAWHRAIREKPAKERKEETKLDLSTLINLKPKSAVPSGFVKRF